MKCPKCNFENEVGSAFCSSCGNKLAAISTSNDDAEILDINEKVETLDNTQVIESNNQNIINRTIQNNEQVTSNNVLTSTPVTSGNDHVATDNNFVKTNEVINLATNMNSEVSVNSSMSSDVTSINKLNRSGNFIVIGLVILIAIITIVSCYLMTTNKRDNEKKDDVVTYNNKVTINGRTGSVPDGWNFVSGVEIGQNDYESVFMNVSYDSFAYVLSSKTSNLSEIKANMYTLKAKLESKGFSDIDVKKSKENSSEYVLFDGLYNGKNYHLLYLADTAGVYGSEGVYASKDDLATIVSFMTKLKRNTAIKIPDDSEQVNFFETILEK